MNDDKYRSCARCEKPFPATLEAIDTWGTASRDGIVTGLICPDCMTSEEHVEKEVRGALDRPAQTFQISSEDLESVWIEAKVYDSGTTEYDRGFREGLRRALVLLKIRIEEETP